MASFLLSLLATLIIEVSLLVFLVQSVKSEESISIWRIIGSGLLASSATLPYLWFVFPVIFSNFNSIYLGELFAVLAESAIFVLTLGLSGVRAFVYALICNLVSYLASPVVGFVFAEIGISPY